MEPDCWFYRNSSGSIEVDLLIEEGARLHPLEIKSSSTYSSDMRKHLEAFCSLTPNAERPLVVYSGETHADVAVNFTEVSGWC